MAENYATRDGARLGSRLVVLDDNESLTEVIREVGKLAGFDVAVGDSDRPLMEALTLHAADVVVLDLQMPEIDGVEVMRILADQKSRASIVLVSGLDPRTIASAARFGRGMGLNVVGALQKPFKIADLLQQLRCAVEKTPSSFEKGNHVNEPRLA
jgi:CheY-like chemotaxis protein